MNLTIGDVLLRQLELRDVGSLYKFKNDPEVATLLGGFSRGYAVKDLQEWLEAHRGKRDEVLWAVADAQTDECLGHVGLYQVDHRISSAEFAILLGEKSVWGKGLGTSITREVLKYGFDWLNLNRIELSVLSSNERAMHVYEGLGFKLEGVRRQAQFKAGVYLDVNMMAILRNEFC